VRIYAGADTIRAMLKRIPTSRALELIRRARQSPQSDRKWRTPAGICIGGTSCQRGTSRDAVQPVTSESFETCTTPVRGRSRTQGGPRVRAVRPASVVELGCGPGRLLTALANAERARDRRPGSQPLHAGASEGPAAARGSPAPPCGGLAVPANQGAFDVAVAAHYVGHLPGEIRAQAVHEITRIVRPGGRVIIAEHSWHPGHGTRCSSCGMPHGMPRA